MGSIAFSPQALVFLFIMKIPLLVGSLWVTNETYSFIRQKSAVFQVWHLGLGYQSVCNIWCCPGTQYLGLHGWQEAEGTGGSFELTYNSLFQCPAGQHKKSQHEAREQSLLLQGTDN